MDEDLAHALTPLGDFYTDPSRPERTLVHFEWYAREAGTQAAQERIRKAVDLAEVVQREDIAICEAVQRGLQSVAYTRGRYSVKRENGVFHFHRLVERFLAR